MTVRVPPPEAAGPRSGGTTEASRNDLPVRRWISVLDWLPHYRRADLPGETYSGTGIVRVEAALSFTNAEPLAHLDARR